MYEELLLRLARKIDGYWLPHRGQPLATRVRGCSEEEVEAVARAQGVELPVIYREFLLKMGRSARFIFGDVDCEWPALLEMRSLAENAASCGGFELPRDACVFSMYDQEQFMYLRASEGPDPPVYYYGPISPEPVCRYESFSQFVRRSLNRQ